VNSRARRTFAHLTYLDNSGTHKTNPVLVAGAVVIPDESFLSIESEVGSVVEQIVPPDLLDEFEEFHAYQLYLAKENDGGVFVHINETTRYRAIRRLLSILDKFKLPFIYSAVHKERLLSSSFASVKPQDAAFRLCVLGVEKWLDGRENPSREEFWPDRCLFIIDDCDEQHRKMFRNSFRSMRLRVTDSDMGLSLKRIKGNRLWHSHDAMYFGDSKDSVGLQIADLCSYFMMRRLRREDDCEFYDLIKPHAICADPEPDFSQFAQWLMRHDA
jgi:hypothetical protein